MKLIIPRITDSTSARDLRAFANQVLEKIFRLPFSATPRILSCSVVFVTDRSGVSQRHGLINVTSDDAALRIIRKLNGKYLKGKRVGVKRYDPGVGISPELPV
jgi:RNA recognition motif-containing protein